MKEKVQFVLEFYWHYIKIIYSKSNEKIDIIPYNNKTNNTSKKDDLIFSSIVIIILGIFFVILNYFYRKYLFFVFNIISYYLELCIISFGISSIMYYFYNNNSRLNKAIYFFNKILKPIMLTVRGFLTTIDKSQLVGLFEKSDIKKEEKFDWILMLIGSVLLILSISGSIYYFMNVSKINIFKYLLFYIIGVYAIIGINIIILAFGKSFRIINIIIGIIILPFILLVSIIASLFKKIKIDLIIKYYTEFSLI